MAPEVVQNKIAKIQALRVDEPKILDALDSLGTFYNVGERNDYESRRLLRSRIQERGQVAAEKFVEACEPIFDQVQRMAKKIETMSLQCNEMAKKLETTSTISDQFLDDINRLFEERKQTLEQIQFVENLLERFEVSDADAEIIRSGPDEEDSGARFFRVCEAVHRKHKALLKLSDSQSQVSIGDCITRLESIVDISRQKISSWIKFRCQSSKINFKAPDQALLESMRALSGSPELYTSAWTNILEAQEAEFSNAFSYLWLHASLPKESEINLCNHLERILTWTRESLKFHKSFLVSLLSESKGYDVSVKENRQTVVSSIRNEIVAMDQIFAAVIPALRSSVHRILKSPGSLLLRFSFYSVLRKHLQHCQELFSSSLNDSNSCRCLDSIDFLVSEARNIVMDATRARCNKLMSMVSVYPRTLSAAPEFFDINRTLAGILSFVKNIEVSQTEPDGRDSVLVDMIELVALVADSLIDPLLRTCRSCATGLDRSDGAIYIINNCAAITCIRQSSFTLTKASSIDSVIDEYVEILVNDQVEKILWRCGIAENIKLVKNLQASAKLINEPGMDLDTLKQSVDRFCRSVTCLELPEYEKIEAADIAFKSKKKTNELLLDTYKNFYNALHDTDTSGYTKDELGKVFLYSTEDLGKALVT